MYQYPYGNAQQLNLDWILSKLQELESGSSGGADLEEVANALVSASFDATIPYRKYDYAFYDGKLYRALNDTIGAFNPSDWLEVTLGADIPVLTRLVNADSALLTTLQNKVNNLGSDDVANESTVTGNTVTDALGTLNGAITSVKNSITPYTEANTTATRNYAVNDFIYIYGNLYVVTNPITQGQTISTQTNVQAINIAECLYPATISSSATETLAGLENNGTLNYNTLVARNGLVNIGYRRSEMTTPVIGNGNILQLPTNLRPKVQQRMVGLAIENGVQININLAIQTTGYVYYYRSNSSNITEILIVGNYFI